MPSASRAQRRAALDFAIGGPSGSASAFRALTRGVQGQGPGIVLRVLTDEQAAALQRLATLSARVQQGMAEILADEVQDAQIRIMERWPRDTGFSKSRWAAVQLGPMTWEIRNSANYAPYVVRRATGKVIAEDELPREIAKTRKLIWRRTQQLVRAETGATGSPRPTSPTTPTRRGGLFRLLGLAQLIR